MKIKKRTLLLALAAVAAAAFVLFQFYAAYALPKMDEESMTLSKEIEASGKPSGVLADYQSCKDGMIPIVKKAERSIALSAKAAPILFAGECSVKLYYVHDKETCDYSEENQICTAEDYGSCIISEGLKKIQQDIMCLRLKTSILWILDIIILRSGTKIISAMLLWILFWSNGGTYGKSIAGQQLTKILWQSGNDYKSG